MESPLSAPQRILSAAPLSKLYLLLSGIIAAMCCGMLIYSQTDAFAQDEGFHLLAAQLIARGKKPYLDFVFPQTPLSAYWNAILFRLFGDTWRTAHAAAALLTSAAVYLLGEYVFNRFPIRVWKFGAAITAVAVFGLNIAVVQFGSLQAYGICLFLLVAGFRSTVAAVERRSVWLAAAAGFCAAAAAGSSLLTAPAGPVLLVWMLFYTRAGNRWRMAAAFVAAGLVAFSPVLWLFAQSPRIVRFNIVEYMLIYRRVQWPSATQHDIGELTAWLDSPQAMLTGLLTIAGVFFLRLQTGWGRDFRRELYLCGWLGAAMCLHVSMAHPTFVRYYILPLPFVAVLACIGLYSIAGRIHRPEHSFWPVLGLTLLFGGGLARALIMSHGSDMAWRDFEAIAAKVEQVTPSNGDILSDEHVYFLTRRTPPPGTEHEDSHGLDFPPEVERELHIFSRSELKRRVESGAFSTVVTCDSDEYQQKEGLPGPYVHKEEISTCDVYWK